MPTRTSSGSHGPGSGGRRDGRLPGFRQLGVDRLRRVRWAEKEAGTGEDHWGVMITEHTIGSKSICGARRHWALCLSESHRSLKT